LKSRQGGTGMEESMERQPLYMSDFAPPKPVGQPKGVIQTFDRVKVVYIFSLVLFHQRMLTAPSHSFFLSDHLPYPHIDHGVECMLGLLLISGWLSSSTWKELPWEQHMKKKVARLMPPFWIAVVFTVVALAFEYQSWPQILQCGLEGLGLGGWNPTLMWYSFNRPLWFVSTLLAYHYVSPAFLRWIRKRRPPQLAALVFTLYLLRQCIALATLLIIQGVYSDISPYVRVIHLWSPTQVWVPFMGAMLEQITKRTALPSWVTATHLRACSNGLMLMLLVLTSLVPSTGYVMLDALIAYANLITGPFIIVLVPLLSCEQNFIYQLTCNTGPRVSQLFGSMLTLSYPLYLLHWPLALLLKRFGLVADDSWAAGVGSSATSIVLTAAADALLLGPCTASFAEWLNKGPQATPQAEATHEKPIAYPALETAANLSQLPSAELMRMGSTTAGASIGAGFIRRSSLVSLTTIPSVQDAILHLERERYVAHHGISALSLLAEELEIDDVELGHLGEIAPPIVQEELDSHNHPSPVEFQTGVPRGSLTDGLPCTGSREVPSELSVRQPSAWARAKNEQHLHDALKMNKQNLHAELESVPEGEAA